VLYQEIRQRGFTRSDQTVRRYVRPFRTITTALPVPAAAPKTRHVAQWVMTDPANLDPDDQARLDAISQGSPAIQALIGHVRGFATMMRNLTGTRDLPQWIASVQTSDLNGLRSFANGIQRDLAALTNGLSLSYSSGPVEGHVNCKNDQTTDVRPSKPRPPSPPYPRALLTPLEPARSRNSCQSLRPPEVGLRRVFDLIMA
jgi:hypothetical protein